MVLEWWVNGDCSCSFFMGNADLLVIFHWCQIIMHANAMCWCLNGDLMRHNQLN